MRPPDAAAIAANWAAIQSRAPKTPCVAVDAVSEKSLRVPKATNASSVCFKRAALTLATIAAIDGSGETAGNANSEGFA